MKAYLYDKYYDMNGMMCVNDNNYEQNNISRRTVAHHVKYGNSLTLTAIQIESNGPIEFLGISQISSRNLAKFVEEKRWPRCLFCYVTHRQLQTTPSHTHL